MNSETLVSLKTMDSAPWLRAVAECPGARIDPRGIVVPMGSDCLRDLIHVNAKVAPAQVERGKTQMEAVGPLMWADLHRWALKVDFAPPRGTRRVREWIDDFNRLIPCGDCSAHWTKMVTENPPDFSSNDALFAWSVARHNDVNRRIGKPEMSVDDARAKWFTA